MKWLKRLIWLALLVMIAVGGVWAYQGFQQYQQALEYLPLDEAVEDIHTQEHFIPIDQIPGIYLEAVPHWPAFL